MWMTNPSSNHCEFLCWLICFRVMPWIRKNSGSSEINKLRGNKIYNFYQMLNYFNVFSFSFVLSKNIFIHQTFLIHQTMDLSTKFLPIDMNSGYFTLGLTFHFTEFILIEPLLNRNFLSSHHSVGKNRFNCPQGKFTFNDFPSNSTASSWWANRFYYILLYWGDSMRSNRFACGNFVCSFRISVCNWILQ